LFQIGAIASQATSARLSLFNISGFVEYFKFMTPGGCFPKHTSNFPTIIWGAPYSNGGLYGRLSAFNPGENANIWQVTREVQIGEKKKEER